MQKSTLKSENDRKSNKFISVAIR